MQFPEKHVVSLVLDYVARRENRDCIRTRTISEMHLATVAHCGVQSGKGTRREGTREGEIYALVARGVSGRSSQTYRSLFLADTVTPDAIFNENYARKSTQDAVTIN